MTTYTPEQASSMGYVSITKSYSHSEREIYDKVIKQMGGCDFIVVMNQLREPEIYRRKSDLKALNE